MSFNTLSSSEFADLCRSGTAITIIDVRTPVEFQEVHLAAARNVPLDQLDPAEFQKSECQAADGLVYVMCRSGSRGRQACEKLAKAGITNIVNVDGGILACIEAGMPVVRGRKVMSLERQVRIAAGALVLAGVTLGWFIHPAFFGLSAFVGAGLVFAGITDTCGMGMILARMPWNRRVNGPTCASH